MREKIEYLRELLLQMEPERLAAMVRDWVNKVEFEHGKEFAHRSAPVAIGYHAPVSLK